MPVDAAGNITDYKTYVRAPFGDGDILTMTAADANQTATILNDITIIDLATNQGTANRTVNVDVTQAVRLTVGFARLIVKSATAGTQTTTLMGSILPGAAVTGVAGKTIVREYVWDGTQFLIANGQAN